MSKRKISHQQERRIKKRLSQRLDLQSPLESVENDLGPKQEGLIIARHGETVEVEDKQQHLFLCHQRQHLMNLVPGDRVIWQQSYAQSGIVSAVLPRTSVLNRPDFHGHPKPIAANITQMLIVFAPLPEPSFDLINKYLIAAELLKISPVLVLNKIDLLPSNHALHDWVSLFKQLDYPVILHTAKNPGYLSTLIHQLKNNTSILLGQSGVGKSSIIGNLLPENQIRIGALSEGTGFGKHTTSTPRLYHIPHGGDLIDSPGVRNFSLWPVSPEEILYGFKECRKVIGQCKFNNCLHLHEPGCAVKELFEKRKISSLRYKSLQEILHKWAKHF